MEVKPRFKQTEIGLIPVDWRLEAISTLAETSSGTTPPRAMYDRYFRNGTTSWVKTLDLNNGRILTTDERVTTEALKETSLTCFPPGSVLVAMYGGFKQIGRTGLLCIPAAVNQALTAIKPDTSQLVPAYLLRVLNARIDHWKTVASSSRKDPNITGKEVREFLVPLPHVDEQEAIAEALSDADALIESLEQLVAKKRQIKHGAMQELLTGHKRLPGFTGEWKVKRLDDEIDLLTGFPFPSQSYTESGVRLLRGSNVKRGVTDWNDEITQYWPNVPAHIQQYLLEAGDIVVAMDGSLVGRSFAQLTQADLPALLLQRVARIRSRSIEVAFLKEQVCSDYFTNYCDAVKTVTAIPHISPKDIRGFQIQVPPTKAEQTAIATILSDMDTEIAAIESKLTKARLIKQGMMQELLTGRIRLV